MEASHPRATPTSRPRLVAIVLAAALVGGLMGGAIGVLLSDDRGHAATEATGPAERAWLGIEAETVDHAIAATALGLPSRGVVVVRVVGGGPAARAGLAASRQRFTAEGRSVHVGGDVIVGIDGEPVDSSDALSAALALHEPGDEVALDVVRDGVRRTIVVTLGTVPGPVRRTMAPYP